MHAHRECPRVGTSDDLGIRMLSETILADLLPDTHDTASQPCMRRAAAPGRRYRNEGLAGHMDERGSPVRVGR